MAARSPIDSLPPQILFKIYQYAATLSLATSRTRRAVLTALSLVRRSCRPLAQRELWIHVCPEGVQPVWRLEVLLEENGTDAGRIRELARLVRSVRLCRFNAAEKAPPVVPECRGALGERLRWIQPHDPCPAKASRCDGHDRCPHVVATAFRARRKSGELRRLTGASRRLSLDID